MERSMAGPVFSRGRESPGRPGVAVQGPMGDLAAVWPMRLPVAAESPAGRISLTTIQRGRE